MRKSTSSPFPLSFVWGAVIVLLTVTAYLPALSAGFIWDDDSHLTQNPCIIGPLGFKDIWTSSEGYYYPLVLTTFWLLHQLVGLNPLPYHLLNVLMHAGCAVVLWRVLLRLGVRAAWFGAALWALHPIMVQSVAWITELKNTQSCFFYLLSILFLLKANGFVSAPGPAARGRPHFALALLFFAMAVTSKTSTVTLPMVLALCLWWRRRRLRWRELAALTPFLLISLAASAWTIWEQKFHSGALGAEWVQTWPQRLATAGHVVWFYLGKIAWPHPLTFIYPHWTIDTAQPMAVLPTLAAAGGLFFLWWKRNGVLRPIFFGVAYFVISLFPVLDFFDVYFFRYSFVSDHLQYLASIGPFALAAAGMTTLLKSFEKKRLWLQPVLCGVLLAILGALTWTESRRYISAEMLWRTTIAQNPACWMAHNNLGLILKDQGKLEEAISHYREALRFNPNDCETLSNLGVGQLGVGQSEQAIESFHAALRCNPESADIHNNLAWLLATSSDGSVRNGVKAVEAAQEANKLSGGSKPAILDTLAAAYAEHGEYDKAIETASRALELSKKATDKSLSARIQRRLDLYRSQQPYRQQAK